MADQIDNDDAPVALAPPDPTSTHLTAEERESLYTGFDGVPTIEERDAATRAFAARAHEQIPGPEEMRRLYEERARKQAKFLQTADAYEIHPAHFYDGD